MPGYGKILSKPMSWVTETSLPSSPSTVRLAYLNDFYLLAITENGIYATNPAVSPVSWVLLDKLPTVRDSFDIAVDTDNEYIYVIGGYNESTYYGMTNVDRFYFRNRSWTTMASLNTGSFYPAAAISGSYIYVAGGVYGSILSNVQRYSISGNSWSNMTALPAVRSRATAVAHNNMIYLLGGTSGGGALATMLRSNTAVSSWSTMANLPVATQSAAAAVYGDYIYLTGGTGNGNLCARYSITNNTWETLKPTTYLHSDHGMAFVGNRLYVASRYGVEYIELN